MPRSAMFRISILLLALAILTSAPLFAKDTPAAPQSTPGGSIKGTVTLQSTGDGLHKARVLIVQLGRSAETGDDGAYLFENVPPGKYDLVARAPALSDDRQSVEVTSGGAVTADFALKIAAVREQVTVTASGREQTALETFQAVNVLDSIQLTEKPQTSLGAALDGEPGVAKRSFGPGSARPVIRGFDGDRVLVLRDGIRTGSLSSQSADHGESINLLSLERLEVVKGPATLLYGSNAIGGVVNAVSVHGQFHDHVHQGLTGYLSGVAGSANSQVGGGLGFEYGTGNWLLWGNASGNRTGDYGTPIGTVFNSETRVANAGGGFGWYGNKSFFSVSGGYENARYGIPFAAAFEGEEEEEDPAPSRLGLAASNILLGETDETIVVGMRQYHGRFTGGFRNLGAFIDGVRLQLDLVNYRHQELEIAGGIEEVGTTFDNKQFVTRATFTQRKAGPLTGQFGVWNLHRNYDTVGAEALAPPINQNSFAAFALEELDFDSFRLQFGGRVEHTSYTNQSSLIGSINRSFTGFSGAAGIYVPLWTGGAFVANYTHSYRAPALEELYNFGPHIGNLTFEIGNPNLVRELSNGIDLSLRQRSSRFRAEANFFVYAIQDFVFLAPTGEIEDGLLVAEFSQGDSRYLGGEFNFDVGFHPNFWLLTGFDLVRAELRSSVTGFGPGNVTIPAGTPLPRIPPLRIRLGADVRFRGLSVRPILKISDRQENLFVTETSTPGFAVVDVDASYTIARQHAVHVFSAGIFNLGNILYRNHLSFIKDLAPEIGRGVRFGYTVRFF